MELPDSQIAVTLFNLRDYCKTESELDATLDKLCAIGYKAVQVSCVPLEPAVIKKQLDKHGLVCCATHDGLAMIKDDTQKLIDKMHTLECDFVALGAPPLDVIKDRALFDDLINTFNEKGQELLAAGIKLGYHNHHFELERYDGRTQLDIMIEDTDPELFNFILDTHWLQTGGVYPPDYIRKVKGRMKVCHFKDYKIENGERKYAEIGTGNLNLDECYRACVESGVEYIIIEQDSCDIDLFESARISFTNLKKISERN